jgi:hypothetical protein
MFKFVSKAAFDTLALELESERIHSKSEKMHYKRVIGGLNERLEEALTKIACLKIANAELVEKLDAKEQMLKETTDRLFDLQLKVSSLESRWGKEATI